LLHRGRGYRARYARELDALGVGFLDCPVSGGVEGARAATLAIMVGGDEAVFERARPILEKIGRTSRIMGGSGAGQAAKATNQIMCAGIIQAVGEAMAFAQAEGCRSIASSRRSARARARAGTSSIARRSWPKKVILRDFACAARQGFAHLPRNGRGPWREAAGGRVDARRICATDRRGPFGDEDISSIYRLKSALFAAGGG
jgi:3-hydroxyisobutyrate dehydrogenase